MPQFTRTRINLVRALAASALTVAVGGSLVACGSDDSTVSSTPETTAAEVTSQAPAEDGDKDQGEDGEETKAPVTKPGEAATAPPETPDSVPSDYPGPAEAPPVGEDGKKFLEGLKNEGITPAGDGMMALSTADYICQAKAAGKSDEDVMVFVTAMVGSEASAAGSEISPEEATAQAQTYVDTANAVYCQ